MLAGVELHVGDLGEIERHLPVLCIKVMPAGVALERFAQFFIFASALEAVLANQ